MIGRVYENLPVAVDEYRRFKRLLYGDAVSDWVGVYEAWWTANAEFPDLSLSQRLHVAEKAVAELIEAGLIRLHRGTWDERPGEAIPREEYDAVLREWATWVIPPDTRSVIWASGDEPADWASTVASL
jgi:hypothetical protein